MRTDPDAQAMQAALDALKNSAPQEVANLIAFARAIIAKAKEKE